MKPAVLCVSAGMLRPKKSDSRLGRRHNYLNYGLLGLATLLSERGYKVSVCHGGFENPQLLAERLAAEARLELSTPVMLSLPSCFAIAWAREFCQAAKMQVPGLKIVIGGRWVTADDGQWIRFQIPAADLVVYGLADGRFEQLLDESAWPSIPMTDRYLLGKRTDTEAAPARLDFGLVDDFSEYQPCVEVSRGCGMGCNYCAEATVPLGSLRAPTEVARELRRTSCLYSGEIRPYFQASFFRPTSKWIDELSCEFRQLGISSSWRAESRVDGLSPQQIESLALCGLKVLDLGLESASPVQLSRMEKTRNPLAYLKRASLLLDACANNGVWAKVNVLLYPGETRTTLLETSDWLDSNRTSIKGVSVGQMIVFRYGGQSRDYLRRVEALGASAVNDGDLDEFGYARLNLSSEVSHAAAMEHGQSLCRHMMTASDYFDLKSFSYFPRSFTREDFDSIVSSEPEPSFPFKSDG